MVRSTLASTRALGSSDGNAASTRDWNSSEKQGDCE